MGIGVAICRALAEAGAKVMLTGQDRERIADAQLPLAVRSVIDYKRGDTHQISQGTGYE